MKVNAVKNFRNNLRAAMLAKKISQRDMAEKSHLTHPYINRVLTGKADPSLEVADALADAIGVSVSVLILPEKNFSEQVLTGGNR